MESNTCSSQITMISSSVCLHIVRTSAFVFLELIIIATRLFILKFHSCDKKGVQVKWRGQELWPVTGCIFLADSHDIKLILSVSGFLLALSRMRQTFCCTKLNGISHKNNPFSAIAWEVYFPVQPGVRPQHQRAQVLTENSGVPISGVNGVSLTYSCTDLVWGLQLGAETSMHMCGAPVTLLSPCLCS